MAIASDTAAAAAAVAAVAVGTAVGEDGDLSQPESTAATGQLQLILQLQLLHYMVVLLGKWSALLWDLDFWLVKVSSTQRWGAW